MLSSKDSERGGIDLSNKFILDACCGGRMMWYQKNHKNVLYVDIRTEDKKGGKYNPNFEIKPDEIVDFRNMPYADESFKLVVFDPPHVKDLNATSCLGRKFGSLNAETWQADLTKGFSECWRVLQPYGLLIFKWSETRIPLADVLKLFKERPLFGHGMQYKTIWCCFMKIPEEMLNVVL